MSAKTSSAKRSPARLAEKRRVRRRRLRYAASVLIVLLIASVIYTLRQSAFRVSHVAIFGGDQALASYATQDMQGYYFGVIPRDSILFFPEDKIRADILAANSDIAALSIFRSGLSSISIMVEPRTAITRWCGLAPAPGVTPTCYFFDPDGVIFAAASSTMETINPFVVYAPLTSTSSDPLGATIAGASDLPSTFDFARQLGTFGSPVESIDIHDGQVDDYLESGTRVSYVLGDEQNAYSALVSAQSDLNLTNGSLEYVDLRFDGKVYVKPAGAEASSTIR